MDRRSQPERSSAATEGRKFAPEQRSESKDTAPPYLRFASKDTAPPYRRFASKDTAPPYLRSKIKLREA